MFSSEPRLKWHRNVGGEKALIAETAKAIYSIQRGSLHVSRKPQTPGGDESYDFPTQKEAKQYAELLERWMNG